jgi:hypothetical protein
MLLGCMEFLQIVGGNLRVLMHLFDEGLHIWGSKDDLRWVQECGECCFDRGHYCHRLVC